jgi:hypothetical protein
MQTIAVINEHIPSLSVGGITAAAFASPVNNLSNTALVRDQALTNYDQAVNAEHLAFLAIRTMVLALAQAAKSDLNEEVPAEGALIDLLGPAFSITPSTTELALKRAGRLIPPLTKINAYNAAQVPARPAVTAGGKALADLQAAVTAQAALEQAVEDRASDVQTARQTLETETHAVDRINKRFYARLQAEARSNPAIAAALSQIDTETDNLPGTLSIRNVMQGGASTLHVLVSYVNGTGENADERFLEYMVEAVDTDFVHSVAVDLSGNQIGPFAVGQTVKIRTRTVNGSGARTSAIRTLLIVAAP